MPGPLGMSLYPETGHKDCFSVSLGFRVKGLGGNYRIWECSLAIAKQTIGGERNLSHYDRRTILIAMYIYPLWQLNFT